MSGASGGRSTCPSSGGRRSWRRSRCGRPRRRPDRVGWSRWSVRPGRARRAWSTRCGPGPPTVRSCRRPASSTTRPPPTWWSGRLLRQLLDLPATGKDAECGGAVRRDRRATGPRGTAVGAAHRPGGRTRAAGHRRDPGAGRGVPAATVGHGGARAVGRRAPPVGHAVHRRRPLHGRGIGRPLRAPGGGGAGVLVADRGVPAARRPQASWRRRTSCHGSTWGRWRSRTHSSSHGSPPRTRHSPHGSSARSWTGPVGIHCSSVS